MEILLKDLAIAWRLADQSHSQQKPTLGKANDSISEAHPNRDTHASSNGGNTGVQAPWPPQEPGPILAQMTKQHSCQQVPKRQTPHRTAVRGWGPTYLYFSGGLHGHTCTACHSPGVGHGHEFGFMHPGPKDLGGSTGDSARNLRPRTRIARKGMAAFPSSLGMHISTRAAPRL
jgi:hypothetical protein